MEAIAALIPSIGVGILFYVLMKAMIGADRKERAAMAKLDRQEAEAAARQSTRDSNPQSNPQSNPESNPESNPDETGRPSDGSAPQE